ncbi:MAG TPA: hypothetical protein VIG62_03815 [Blastocatellia bacterium]|jgi:hypothetical protein
MFEQPTGKVEKDRSRLIMVVSAVAVLAVIGLIIIVTQVWKPSPSHEEFERVYAPAPEGEAIEGSQQIVPPGQGNANSQPQSEAQAYAHLIEIAGIDKRTGVRLNTNYARILCTVRNNGDRVVTGMQLRMILYAFGGQVIKDKIVTPVPQIRETLGAGETMDLDVSIDRSPRAEEIMDMRLELYSLKLR